MRNVGLIIQGPLQSFGKSGRTAAQKLNLGDEGLVHYDCLSNIQRIGDEFGDLFCEIILSTWDTERRPEHAWRGFPLLLCLIQAP